MNALELTTNINSSEYVLIPFGTIREIVRLNSQKGLFRLYCDYGVNSLRSIVVNLQHFEELFLWSPQAKRRDSVAYIVAYISKKKKINNNLKKTVHGI